MIGVEENTLIHLGKSLLGRVALWRSRLLVPVVVLSVCPLVMTVYCGKTADSVEMPFGTVGRVGPRNHGDRDRSR